MLGYAELDEALADPEVQFVVIATPHDTHAELAVRALDSGRHCVVDKVMALTTADADRMIAARDRSGCMLSVFHNRRWDWDYLTVKEALSQGILGRPLLDRELGLPPRSAPELARSGPVRRHDPARLGRASRRPGPSARSGPVPPAHRLALARSLGKRRQRRPRADRARVRRRPFPDRIEPDLPDRPPPLVDRRHRGGFVKYGIDPQEDALRAGDIDRAAEPPEFEGILRRADSAGQTVEIPLADRPGPLGQLTTQYRRCTSKASSPLAVTAEQAREVVRLLEAATRSARDHMTVTGPWGET